MSIKLEYLLQRNKISFEDFCVREKINSFEDLLSYCTHRGFEPCAEEEFNSIFIVEKDLKIEEPAVLLKSEPEKKPTTRKRTTRKRESKPSTARKVSKVRDADK